MTAAPTPPSSPPLDVVREWREEEYGTNRKDALAEAMAQTCTAQAKRIEGLERDKDHWHRAYQGYRRDFEAIYKQLGVEDTDDAETGKRLVARLLALIASEATVTELRAEVERLKTFVSGGGQDLLDSEQAWKARATTAEAEVERLTGVIDREAIAHLERLLAVSVERDTAQAALAKIDAIRNDIIARQTINWSAHIYPLVAALGEAGYEGVDYETARAVLPSPTLPPTKGEGR